MIRNGKDLEITSRPKQILEEQTNQTDKISTEKK